MIESTQALVLNKRNYGDSSLICNLFSKENGKITIIAKGAKSIKNPLGALLQPLNYIECTYYYKSTRNIQTLKEASLIDKYYNIEKDYKKMQYSLIILDIVNQINYIDSPSKIIFRLVNRTLNSINNEKVNNIDILFVFFQLQYLIYLGYYPSIENCIKCEDPLDSAQFDYLRGQLLCCKCGDNELLLNKECLAIMKFLIKTHITEIINQFNFNKNLCKSINKFLYKFILYHIPEIKKSKALKIINHV